VSDAALACGFHVAGPSDAEPVAAATTSGEVPVVDPVVDGAGADPQAASGVGDTEFSLGIRRWHGDLVQVPDPLHGVDVEAAAVPGAQPGCVQFGDEVVVAGGRAEAADQLDCGGRGGGGGGRGRRAAG